MYLAIQASLNLEFLKFETIGFKLQKFDLKIETILSIINR
jgi:hypothetical protein